MIRTLPLRNRGTKTITRVAALLRPGPGGRLLSFIAALALATVAAEWRVLGSLALAVVLALLLSRGAILLTAKDKTWPVLALLAVGLGSLIGERDIQLGGVYLSSAGLSMGVQMMVRALTILLAVHTLTTTVSLSTIASVLERVGLRGLGFALGVAVNTLPVAQRNFRDVVTALRLRGGFRRRRLCAARAVLLTTMINTVRNAEDVVAAAEARGFHPSNSRPAHIGWQTGDLALAALLVAAGVAILVPAAG